MTDKRTARARCYWAWDCHTCDRQNLSEYEDTHVAKCNHCGASVSVEIVDSYAADLAAEATRLTAENERLREACKEARVEIAQGPNPSHEVLEIIEAALRGSEP